MAISLGACRIIRLRTDKWGCRLHETDPTISSFPEMHSQGPLCKSDSTPQPKSDRLLGACRIIRLRTDKSGCRLHETAPTISSFPEMHSQGPLCKSDSTPQPKSDRLLEPLPKVLSRSPTSSTPSPAPLARPLPEGEVRIFPSPYGRRWRAAPDEGENFWQLV